MTNAFPIRQLGDAEFPPLLREIPEPPETLFLRGELPPPGAHCLAVVGSRDYSNYGKQVVEYLIRGLRGHNIAIISGLALGIDARAHEAALDSGLYTLAIPGSGIDDTVLYPQTNRRLAYQILEQGGGILSEFEPSFTATKWSFPKRNRIMAGMSHATLMIEASEKSGTLITARLTVDYNRELLVVPGNIFGENSKGPHQFLKLGATPITTPDDILAVFNIEQAPAQEAKHTDYSAGEMAVIQKLKEPMDRDSLIRALGLNTSEANTLLMDMELKGILTESNGVMYKIDT